MALALKDRVKETSTTTGTGTYTLAGAVTGFETFGQVGNGNTTYYTCTDGTDFETGIGTYTSSGTTLARTTILQSSNSDSAVSWSSGTKTLFVTLPAEKMSFKDASDNVNFADNEKAVFGVGNDLQVYHDGSHSYVSDAGTGNLQLSTNGTAIKMLRGNGEVLGSFNIGGSVDLYHSNAKKFETTATGVNVTGTLAATAVTGDGSGLTNLPSTGATAGFAVAMAIAL
jgi:hypothetical protein